MHFDWARPEWRSPLQHFNNLFFWFDWFGLIMGWMFCICDGRHAGRYKAPSHLFLPGENAPTVHSGFYSSDKKVHLIKNIHLKKISNKKKFQWKSQTKNKKFYSYIFNKNLNFKYISDNKRVQWKIPITKKGQHFSKGVFL